MIRFRLGPCFGFERELLRRVVRWFGVRIGCGFVCQVECWFGLCVDEFRRWSRPQRRCQGRRVLSTIHADIEVLFSDLSISNIESILASYLDESVKLLDIYNRHRLLIRADMTIQMTRLAPEREMLGNISSWGLISYNFTKTTGSSTSSSPYFYLSNRSSLSTFPHSNSLSSETTPQISAIYTTKTK
ncbi:hypothetical protein QJS10_CPB18g00285 [Acorus calamus]|uniref:Uncharacterized protein n=1 Tax=Acorus calamus TaxID=4465 RepID=A0AAV9CKP6_ACOCL|nr:hypothetical protein QJS10_CPB18g00285 [Acorus calamus]